MKIHDEKNEQKCKVIIVTFEFGKSITGGIGRVVNNIAAFNNKIDIDYSFLYLKVKYFFGLLCYKMYKKTNHKYKNVFSRNRLFFYFKELINKKHSAIFYPVKLGMTLTKIITNLIESYYTYKLIYLFKREKYDFIHIMHAGHIMDKFINFSKRFFPSIRIIYSCHSILKFEYDIRRHNHDMIKHESYIMENTDYIQLLNISSLYFLEKSYPEVLYKKPVIVLPNSIEENDYKEISVSYKNELLKKINKNIKTIILCISRWSHGKGLEIFLDAIPEVIKHVDDIKIVIAGRKIKSWENESNNYIKMIDEKIEKIRDYAIPLGWLNDLERNTILDIADIFIMPSMLEYFPYSILEPVICKVPVISSRIDSVVEMLNENTECLFYNAKNPMELASKIVYFIMHKEVRKKIALNAYNKVKKKYCQKVIQQKYKNMYLSLRT